MRHYTHAQLPPPYEPNEPSDTLPNAPIQPPSLAVWAQELWGAMGRPAKLRRIAEIRHALPHVTKVAPSRFFTMASEGELPDACSTGDIRTARDQQAFQSTMYGPVMCSIQMVTKKGKALDVEIVDPIPYLHSLGKRARWRAFLEETRAKAAPSADAPWRIIMCSGVAKPGNKLNQRNMRATEN
eukprot:952398-Pyramimonas_sp.AAC.1